MATDDERLDKVFAECLKHHPEGWAPYEQLNAEDMKPGDIGYIDSNGSWRHITNVLDATALNMFHWEVPRGLYLDKRGGQKFWPKPKTSRNMRGGGTEIEARVE